MWSLDRRVALTAIIGAALAIAIPLVIARGNDPVGREGDRITLAQEVAALANRGADTQWLVTFAFTRTNAAGDQLHNSLAIAHTAAIEVDDGLGSLVVTTAGHTYSCTIVIDKPSCLNSPNAQGTTKPGAVFGGAVVSGRYDIKRGDAETIAGLPATCFVLTLKTSTPIAGLGYSSEQCYSSEGVPLRSRITRPGGTDERVALTVRRTVGRSDLLPLLTQYGLAALAPAK